MGRLSVAIFTGLFSLTLLVNGSAHAANGPVPSPALDAPLSAAPGEQVAVLGPKLGVVWGLREQRLVLRDCRV